MVELFIEYSAASTALPGGGSAASAAAAMAAGLATMVASMSRGKKAYLEYESQLSAAIAHLSALREELKAAIDADAASYNSVMKAYKQAKTSNEMAAQAGIDSALKEATAVPLGVAKCVCKLVRRRYHIVDQTDLAQIEAARQMETQPFVLHLFGSQFQELDLGSYFQPDGWVSGLFGRQSHLRENDGGILAHLGQSSTCQLRDPARGAWYRIETA